MAEKSAHDNFCPTHITTQTNPVPGFDQLASLLRHQPAPAGQVAGWTVDFAPCNGSTTQKAAMAEFKALEHKYGPLTPLTHEEHGNYYLKRLPDGRPVGGMNVTGYTDYYVK